MRRRDAQVKPHKTQEEGKMMVKASQMPFSNTANTDFVGKRRIVLKGGRSRRFSKARKSVQRWRPSMA